jgi:hypothetical protein
MRTLVIAGDYPWPEDRGPRMRLAMVLRGLRSCGPVELISVISRFREDFGPPDPAMELDKVARVGFDNRAPSGLAALATLGRPSMPLGMPWGDRQAVQRALARFMSGHYDLVWFFGARPWVLTGERAFGPTVIDLDDLEDQKIEARMSSSGTSPSGLRQQLRLAGSAMVSGEEVRRWRRLHRRAAARVSTIVVCSELDADRARRNGLGNVEVVPNGYRVPDRPVQHRRVGSPPTILFQGLLLYPPNIEAARYLATDVGPALRQLVPSAQIRLVGSHHPDLMSLHDPPRVTLVGRVPDIAIELERADLVVVPIRYGSGTRIKIIEAFAHEIPVVSTPLGAEGLDVEDGVQLLLGESAPALAAACARLLAEPTLRQSVIDHAHRLYTERYRSEVIEEMVSRLANRVGASGATQ